MCRAPFLNEIYTPLKFHVQICISLWDIAPTNLWRTDWRPDIRTNEQPEGQCQIYIQPPLAGDNNQPKNCLDTCMNKCVNILFSVYFVNTLSSDNKNNNDINSIGLYVCMYIFIIKLFPVKLPSWYGQQYSSIRGLKAFPSLYYIALALLSAVNQCHINRVSISKIRDQILTDQLQTRMHYILQFIIFISINRDGCTEIGDLILTPCIYSTEGMCELRQFNIATNLTLSQHSLANV